MEVTKKLFHTKVFFGQLSFTLKKKNSKILIFNVFKVLMKKWGNYGQLPETPQHMKKN